MLTLPSVSAEDWVLSILAMQSNQHPQAPFIALVPLGNPGDDQVEAAKSGSLPRSSGIATLLDLGTSQSWSGPKEHARCLETSILGTHNVELLSL